MVFNNLLGHKNFFLRGIIFLLVLLVPFFSSNLGSLAEDPNDTLSGLQQKRLEIESKIADLQGKEKTLKNEITLMESRINVTVLKIREAETAIKFKEEELGRLSGDIVLVSGKIDLLGKTLEEQRGVFSARAVASYKSSYQPNLELFIGSLDFSYFINRLKYLKVFELNDNKFLRQMEDTKKVFQTQKIILADKKDQVAQIKTQIEINKKNLEVYKKQLDSQKIEKQNLLTLTSNDENKYQQLLAQVMAELAAIKRFVNLQGGATILSNQTVCNDWGCYYNQRDSNWGTRPLGASSLSMAEYGCLVSSSAMIATHYKKNLNPEDIAANPSAFFSPDSSTAYLWKDITVNGVRIDRTDLSPTTNSIDAELSAGRPVIVGLYRGPAHFIVIKSGSKGDYIMNDPFVENGHDVSFNSKYPLSAITNVERVDVY